MVLEGLASQLRRLRHTQSPKERRSVDLRDQARSRRVEGRRSLILARFEVVWRRFVICERRPSSCHLNCSNCPRFYSLVSSSLWDPGNSSLCVDYAEADLQTQSHLLPDGVSRCFASLQPCENSQIYYLPGCKVVRKYFAVGMAVF